jgi:hypothetical protein
MRRKLQWGGAAIEFALALFVLLPLFLGVTGIGLSMLKQMQTVQLARDAGSMSARKVNFTLAGNQNILSQVAGSLSLTPGSGTTGTAGAGNVVVILSTLQYVSGTLCGQATPPLAANTTACPNLGQWVFAKQIVVGNSSLGVSRLGTPAASIISTTDGTIAINDQCKTASAAVSGSNPWTSSTIPSTDLPTLQSQPIYVSEAIAIGFRLPPFSGGTITYSQFFF